MSKNFMHSKRPARPIISSILLLASVIFGFLPFSASEQLKAVSGLQARAAATDSEEATPWQSPPTLAWGAKIKNPKAVILCIHGLGLHKGTYAEFGKVMSARAYPVYAIDVRGFGDFHLHGNDALDLNQTMLDIKSVLENLRKLYPSAPIFVLGESMGGAIALRAAALNQDLIAGLVSSVPSGDRWSGLGEDLKVGLHVLAGGFGGRFNVGKHVIKHASKSDESLRQRWSDDPASRSQFSPDELIAFQSFMNKNNESAAQVNKIPVLILQGAQDKLVRPGGSFFVWDHLGTPDRTFAVSKTAEHLIFEYGQFGEDDIRFLLDWMAKSTAPLPDQKVSDWPAQIPPSSPRTLSKDEILASTPDLAGKHSTTFPPDKSQVIQVAGKAGLPSLGYWIELMRDGKRYRCNNKTSFKSGDEIRLHLTAGVDGFAYILMKQGTSGAHAVLFPEARTGRNNAVSAMKDYALPSATWLKFDEKPGVEKVCLIFSRTPLDPDTNKYMNMKQTVIVSADRSGSKDLCPTRMQLSWDDPNPLIMPGLGTDVSMASNSSMIRVSQKDEEGTVIAVDIDLEHKQ